MASPTSTVSCLTPEMLPCSGKGMIGCAYDDQCLDLPPRKLMCNVMPLSVGRGEVFGANLRRFFTSLRSSSMIHDSDYIVRMRSDTKRPYLPGRIQIHIHVKGGVYNPHSSCRWGPLELDLKHVCASSAFSLHRRNV